MTDGDDVTARFKESLRRAAESAYEAAHGAIEERDDNGAAPRWRFLVTPRVAVTLVLVAALVGSLVVFWPRGGGPAALTLASGAAGALPTGAALPTAGALAASTRDQASVVVDVAGAVEAPGVYTIPAGSRVTDAIDAAGGAIEGTDLSGLNLARVLVDGEQVLVLIQGQAPVADGLININTADAAALDGLPGVGPVLAGRIVDYRTAHGPFASVDGLDAVTGVGPAVLEEIRPAASV